jgi:hypothetical protein
MRVIDRSLSISSAVRDGGFTLFSELELEAIGCPIPIIIAI